MEKRICCLFGIALMLFFMSCKQPKNCIVKEWDVIDLYRHNYPSVIDTSCDNKINIVERYKLNESLIDSTFSKTVNGRVFKIDTTGIFTIVSHSTIEQNNNKNLVVKLQYLKNGENIDQQILLWLLQKTGVIIQQESKYKKIYLLRRILYPNGKQEETEKMVEQIMQDTVLFPPVPSMP